MRNRVLPFIFLSFFCMQIAAGQTDQAPSSSQAPRPSTGVVITNVPPFAAAGENTREGLDQSELQDRARSEARQQPVDFPPEPNIEFQDFVASSLGYELPIFGQDLFRNAPSTFAPLDRVPVTPDYLIGPGDELLIRAWGQIDVNYRAVVDRDGTVYIPKIGSISVAGVRYDALTDHFRAALGRLFRNFDVDVQLGRLRSIQVFVVGQVRRPGAYTISSLSTLVNALFASGGPSNRGSKRRIILKRDGKDITAFDLYDLLAFGDKTRDQHLLPGDVIYVSPVGQLVALAGSVNVPAIYELKDHETLGDVLKYAGGLTTTASGQKVFVDRIDDHRVRRTAEFDLAKGESIPLSDGDIVRFQRISLKFDNAITLRGNVAVPGRYPWHEGMRIKDLIPSREFLVTQEFWKRQNKLAVDPDSLSFKTRDEAEADRRRQAEESNRSTSSQPAAPGRSPAQYQNPSGPPQGQPTGQGQRPRDEDLASQVGRTEAERIKQEELKNEVKRSAAEINWEYAVVQRMKPDDLSTELVPFNLGKAIAGDASQNVALQPGDVVTIFSQRDMQVPAEQQTKFVRLEGEFNSAGVYQVKDGETLRHLISRVGGLTPEAYLYGAEFTRESAREDQQKRLDEYINQLETSIDRSASAQRGLTGDEALGERQALEGQRRLLARLRQIKASGRIVLELKRGADDLDQLPDLALEDGDRLLVPFRPATLNVIGSVYNSNSFIFKDNKNVGDYLRLAGGATRDGDRSRLFIIRADGSTVGSSGHRGWFNNTLAEARLLPGDTIVVPEKLNRGVVLRGFKDWTQIISTFVIGAAAAKVLFP